MRLGVSRSRGAPSAKAGSGAGPAGVALPAALAPPGSGGRPLPAALRGVFEARLGTLLDDVRVHDDGVAAGAARARHAAAFTVGGDIHFGAGQYAPERREGRQLLAHELVHVEQQRGGARLPAVSGTRALEAEADHLGRFVADGGQARVAGAGRAGTPQCRDAGPPLSATVQQLDALWVDWKTPAGKAKVFSWFRTQPFTGAAAAAGGTPQDGAPPPTIAQADPGGVQNYIDQKNAIAGELTPDEHWLLSRLLTLGPEPLWPAAELAARQRLKGLPLPTHVEAILGHTTGIEDAKRKKTAAEIETELRKRDPSLSANDARDLVAPKPIPVHIFTGQTSERALVIAGVHGQEQSGIEVVRRLVDDMTSGKFTPYYTVVVVPTLFPDASAAAQHRRVVDSEKPGRYPVEYRDGALRNRQRAGGGVLEPNRNFPLETRDAAGSLVGGVYTDANGDPILPENVMLMQLVERYRPARIASVHAKSSLSSDIGDTGPSITNDWLTAGGEMPATDTTRGQQKQRIAELGKFLKNKDKLSAEKQQKLTAKKDAAKAKDTLDPKTQAADIKAREDEITALTAEIKKIDDTFAAARALEGDIGAADYAKTVLDDLEAELVKLDAERTKLVAGKKPTIDVDARITDLKARLALAQKTELIDQVAVAMAFRVDEAVPGKQAMEGNRLDRKRPSARYTAPHPPGTSGGEYFPGRGVPVITVEVAKYELTPGARPFREDELRGHVAGLEEIFLGPPDAAKKKLLQHTASIDPHFLDMDR